MAQSRTRVWIPILIAGILITVGLVICASVVLSLIPLYIENKAVDESSNTELVYTVNSLDFSIGSSSGRRRRDGHSFIPTSNMIISMENEFNILFAAVNGRVVLSSVTMSSISLMSLTLKIYFSPACVVCRSNHRRRIKKILKKKLKFKIYLEYSVDCSLDSIPIGLVPIQLGKDGVDSGNGSGESGENDDIDRRMSGPVRTPIASLVRQVDICGTRPDLIFPDESECKRTENNGVIAALTMNNETDQEYCFAFVAPRIISTIEVQFTFSSVYQDGYFGIDSIQLISKTDLIINGNFEGLSMNSTTNSTNSTESIDPWIVSQCSQSCSIDVNTMTDVDLPQSFVCSGPGIMLRQIVNLNTVGRRSVYLLKFSLGYTSLLNTMGVFIVSLRST